MSSAAQARQALLRTLEGVLGPGPAATMRRLLPTLPWREAVDPSLWLRSDVMALVDNPRRCALQRHLEEALGREHAATFMEFLPPLPWRELERRGVRIPHQG